MPNLTKTASFPRTLKHDTFTVSDGEFIQVWCSRKNELHYYTVLVCDDDIIITDGDVTFDVRYFVDKVDANLWEIKPIPAAIQYGDFTVVKAFRKGNTLYSYARSNEIRHAFIVETPNMHTLYVSSERGIVLDKYYTEQAR